jgi:hypothetical protein
MLSSANYVREAGVQQSGQQYQSDLSPEVLKDQTTMIYEHAVKGAKIFMADGAELVFQGGLFVTRNPEIIRELNKIANKQGTMVTTNTEAMAKLRKEVNKAAEDAARPAAEGNIAGDTVIPLEKPAAPPVKI